MATYYVATDGSNNWSGTISQPFKTITYAISKVTRYAGDTIYVRAGTYNERVLVYNKGGSTGIPTIISAYNYPNETVIIDGTGLDPGAGGGLIQLYDDTTFNGFEIRNSCRNGVYTVGSYNTFSNCIIHDCSASGATILKNYNVMENCIVYNTAMANYQNADGKLGNSWGSGISACGSSPTFVSNYNTIRNCIVHDIWGEGISTFESTHTIIEDNIIYDVFSVMLYVSDTTDTIAQRNLMYTTKNMLQWDGSLNGSNCGLGLWDEGQLPDGARNVLINNICINNNLNCGIGDAQTDSIVANNIFVNSQNYDGTRPYAIVFWGTNSLVDFSFKNNIIIQEDDSDTLILSSQTGCAFSNNLYNKTSSYYLSYAVGDGDIIANASIARDGSTGAGVLDSSYFELLPNSPAIGAGVYISDVSLDYNSNIRNNPPCMGPLEYDYSLPVVETSTASMIYTTSASCGGYIISDGSATILSVGVCWSISEGPTIADSSTLDGSTRLYFSSSLTGLNSSTHYHVRAYAISVAGVGYGTDVSFNTLSAVSDVSTAFKYILTPDNKILSIGGNYLIV